MITKEDIRQQEAEQSREFAASELWAVAFGDCIINNVARQGYKHHPIYGEVCMGVAVTKASVQSALTGCLKLNKEFRLSVFKELFVIQDTIDKQIKRIDLALLAEQNRVWFRRRYLLMTKLRSNKTVLVAHYKLLADINRRLRTLKPKAYDTTQ